MGEHIADREGYPFPAQFSGVPSMHYLRDT